MNSRQNLLLTFFLLFFLFGYAHKIVVKNIDELNNANNQARPGDTIVLKNGEWKDVTIKLSCTGSEPVKFSSGLKSAIQFNSKGDLGIFVIGGEGRLELQSIHVNGEGLQLLILFATIQTVLRYIIL